MFLVIIMQTKELNVLVLAYLGDTIYENYVRKNLIKKGIANVNDLQRVAVNYVSAKSQTAFESARAASGWGNKNKSINALLGLIDHYIDTRNHDYNTFVYRNHNLSANLTLSIMVPAVQI